MKQICPETKKKKKKSASSSQEYNIFFSGSKKLKIQIIGPSVVVQAFSPGSREVEAGRDLRVPGQP